MQFAHTVAPNNQVVAGSSHVCGRSNSFGMWNNPQDSSQDATFSKRRPAQYKVTTLWHRGSLLHEQPHAKLSDLDIALKKSHSLVRPRLFCIGRPFRIPTSQNSTASCPEQDIYIRLAAETTSCYSLTLAQLHRSQRWLGARLTITMLLTRDFSKCFQYLSIVVDGVHFSFPCSINVLQFLLGSSCIDPLDKERLV